VLIYASSLEGGVNEASDEGIINLKAEAGSSIAVAIHISLKLCEKSECLAWFSDIAEVKSLFFTKRMIICEIFMNTVFVDTTIAEKYFFGIGNIQHLKASD
jgi:hypothetical protein